MGVDYGERRIGIAVSDPTGTLASPLRTLRRRAGKRPPLKALADLAVEQSVELVVFGLPLDLGGNETDWTREVRSVGDRLGARLGLPVRYVDERFTSAQAQRAARSAELSRSKRRDKGRVDAAAAALILQRWLDGRER